MTDYSLLLASVDYFKSKRILCIGDVMLDRYVYGEVERISPEAPIPVLSMTHEESMLGAAGNVAKNIAALGAKVDFYCVVGDDKAGFEVKGLLAKEICITPFVSTNSSVRTTVKTRFLAGSQQILRVDSDRQQGFAYNQQPEVISCFDAVVISDYDKGSMIEEIASRLIRLANETEIPVIVDSKSPMAQYRHATVYTPNLGELEKNVKWFNQKGTEKEIIEAATQVMQEHMIDNVLVTRASKGMTLIHDDYKVEHIPAKAKEVYDVVGAGDTVAAVLALGLACGMSVLDASIIANIAGGIVVGKRGTAICTPLEIKTLLLEQMQCSMS